MNTRNTADRNVQEEGALTDRVMKLVDIMKELIARAKQGSSITAGDWAPLEELVESEEFERVGPFHDALDLAGYTDMLTQWVNSSEGWDPVVKRITEAPGLVYLQCEELITQGDRVFPFYSLSMYEFNDAMKICRINVYMQQEMPGA